MLYALSTAAWLSAAVFGWHARGRDQGRLLYDTIAIFAYVPLTLLFFWRPIFTENVMVPRGGGDLASFIYPMYSFAASSIQRGVLPLWNPHLYTGSPFAADIQSGLFYPVNLSAFLWSRPFSYHTVEELAIINYFLAAVFTFIYVRSLGLDRLPAFAAGAIFAFSGFMVAHLGHLNMIAAVVWLPLILFFFHRALHNGNVIAAVMAGAAYGVSLLAGHTQIALYVAFVLALYWLWHLLARQATGLVPGAAHTRLWLRIATLPITGVVGVAVSAVHLLPAYELMRLSVRADITYAKAVEFAASPTGLITLLIPHFFGDNPSAYWGLKWNLTEVYGYVGILPLVLAGAAILIRARRSSIVSFFVLLATLSVLLSLGEHTALHGWLYKFIPGFDKVRSAGRFLMLYDFAVAVLAAFALQALQTGITWRDRRIFRLYSNALIAIFAAGIFVVAPLYYHALVTSQDKDYVIFQRIQGIVDSLNISLVFLGASIAILLATRYLRRSKMILQYLTVIVVILDLFSANSRYNPTTENILAGFDHPEVLRFIKSQGDISRIDSVTNIWDIWQPDITLLNGIDDVQGIFNPMLLADFNTYWESLGSRSTAAYDLLNAKYVVARKDVVLDWQKFKPVLTDAPLVNVYENVKAMPRAWLVPAAATVARSDILKMLKEPDFNPQEKVFLEEPMDTLLQKQDAFAGRVLRLEYLSANEVGVTIESNSPAVLVFSEVYYPGWRAFIDGKETRVLRANYIFKSVIVPAGMHEIKLVFQPRIWEVGLATSAVAWLMVIALVAFAALKSSVQRK